MSNKPDYDELQKLCAPPEVYDQLLNADVILAGDEDITILVREEIKKAALIALKALHTLVTRAQELEAENERLKKKLIPMSEEEIDDQSYPRFIARGGKK